MDKILKNSSYILIAQVVVKVIAFFYTLFLARNLGVNNFGLYSVALSYFALVSSISDFGISRYLIREISRDERSTQSLLTAAFILRLLTMFLIFVFFAFFVFLYDPFHLRAALVTLAVLAVVPQAVALTFDSVFVALQRLYLSALGVVVLSVATAITGFYLIGEGFGAFGAVLALVIGQIVYGLFLLLLSFKQKVFFDSFTFVMLKKIVLGSLPYGFLGVLGLLYFKVDTLMLSYMRGLYDTGIYSAAYKFLEAIVFIPSALSMALFPVFAKMSESDPQKLYKLYVKALVTLFFVGIAVMFSYLLVLPFVVEIFLPQYRASIEVIKILSLTIPLLFMISPQSLVLLSKENFLKPLIYMSIFNLALNVLLNLYAIPRFGYIGSAWVTVVSDLVGFSIFFVYIRGRFIK